MTDETATVDTEATEAVESTNESSKTAPKSEKSRKPRKPKLKDWVRVIKSNGNGLPNTAIHLRINEATGLAELVTTAPKQEGNDEMEPGRTQVFQITSFEVFNDPSYNPIDNEDQSKSMDTTKENADVESPK